MRIIKYFTVASCIFICNTLCGQQTNFFRTYGLGVYDVGEVILPLSDTTYIVAGTTSIGGPNGTSMLLFKTNSIGDVIWYKAIGGTGIQNAKSVVEAVDGSGFYLVGFNNDYGISGYDVWLVKTDLNGDTLWSKKYGGNDWDLANSITALQDSTYLIAGETYSYGAGQKDIYLIKINNLGDTIWTKTFGGADDDGARHVLTDRHNNILVVGNTESFGQGLSDAWLLYLNDNGDTIWTKALGTTEDDFGYSAAMHMDSTNNSMEFVVGYTSYYSPDSAQNAYVAVIDTVSGSTVSLHPQYVIEVEMLDHIMVNSDSGACFFSAEIRYGLDQNSIGYIQLANHSVSPYDERTFAGGVNENTKPRDIKRALDGGYVLTGFSEYWGPGNTSAFIYKVTSDLTGPETPVVNIEKLEDNQIQIFPNPITGSFFYINSGSPIQKVSIYSMNGQLVHQSANQTSQAMVIHRPNVSNGIYVICIQTDLGEYRSKIIFN